MSFPEIPGEPLERVVEIHHHHYHAGPPPSAGGHGWLRFIVKDLETNPHSQFSVHKWGAVYWLVNFPVITALYIFEPRLWLALGIFITLIYSIYANFATDYGAMSAAMAAFGDPPPPPITVNAPEGSGPGLVKNVGDALTAQIRQAESQWPGKEKM